MNWGFINYDHVVLLHFITVYLCYVLLYCNVTVVCNKLILFYSITQQGIGWTTMIASVSMAEFKNGFLDYIFIWGVSTFYTKAIS